jgi:hypothetical protein
MKVATVVEVVQVASLLLLSDYYSVEAFTTVTPNCALRTKASTKCQRNHGKTQQQQQPGGRTSTFDDNNLQLTPKSSRALSLSASTTAALSLADEEGSSAAAVVLSDKKEQLQKQIKEEGGRFAFMTKYGALNPFAIYWGIVSVGLGLVWLVAIESCRAFYFLTRSKIDKKRRLPIFLSHIWGTLLLRSARSYPKIENRHYIREMYKT